MRVGQRVTTGEVFEMVDLFRKDRVPHVDLLSGRMANRLHKVIHFIHRDMFNSLISYFQVCLQVFQQPAFDHIPYTCLLY